MVDPGEEGSYYDPSVEKPEKLTYHETNWVNDHKTATRATLDNAVMDGDLTQAEANTIGTQIVAPREAADALERKNNPPAPVVVEEKSRWDKFTDFFKRDDKEESGISGVDPELDFLKGIK